MNRFVRLVCIASALSLAAGCASGRKDNIMRERAGQHVYSQPASQVYAGAVQLLKEKKYGLREDPRNFTAVSEWKQESGGSSLGTVWTAFQVMVKPLSPSSCTVMFIRKDRVEGGSTPDETRYGGGRSEASPVNNSTGGRDLQMELELLKRLDPAVAEAIRASAEQAH
jgi:hypothetical protein